MAFVEIKKGSWVVVQGKAAQIVCLVDLDKVEVKFRSNKSVATVGISEVEIIPSEPQGEENSLVEKEDPDVSSISPDEMELASKRFYAISKYLSGEISRQELDRELEVSQGALYKLIKLYDEQAGPISLVRMKRGVKKGQQKMPAEVEEAIRIAIDKEYKGRASSYSRVWKEVECICIEKGLAIPSLGTVTARVKSLGGRELYKRKYGTESTQQKFEARPGKVEVSAPLQRTQIDHTLVDVILVDEKSRRPVGRPWLSIIIDIYTRVILGYYLGFNAPSALSVACAISHAVMPKAKFLERIGLPLEKYPFYGCPEIIHMDNAKEFKSSKLIKALAIHNIKPEWRPLGKKHYGGHIERLIGTLMTTEVHFLPGATFSNPVMRRGYDSEKNAALTFKEFSKWFARQVVVYHNTVHSSLGMTPLQAWEKHFKPQGGAIRIPSLISDPLEFKLDFMPEEMRSIHPWGVTLFNKRYWSPALVPYIGLKRVQIKYDPLSMGTIWAKLDKFYVALNFSNVTESDFSLEDRLSARIANIKVPKIRKGSLQDDSVVKIKREGEKEVAEAIAETKRSKKALAAQAEYQSSQLTSTPTYEHTTTKNTEAPDYTKKPMPFTRGT